MNSLKETATKQTARTSGREGRGGALTSKQVQNGSSRSLIELEKEVSAARDT